VLAAAGLPRSAATAAAGPPHPARPRLSLADILGLLRSPMFLVFLLAASAVQSAHAAFYAFGTLHWAAQGYSGAWLGTLWGIGVMVEIGLMAFSRGLVRRVGAIELMVLGAIASMIRWIVMGLDPPLAALIPLQGLHGLTYGATQIGAFYFMTRAVPERQSGTAQALYASVTAGIGMGGAMLLAGHLYATHGGRTYWAMAAIAAVGLAASLVLRGMRRRGTPGST
jgi:PPP family 3-phenylpropionic acid transporter